MHPDLGRRRPVGYAIGSVLYDSVGHWLIQLYGYGDKVEALRDAYAHWGGWIILNQGGDADPLQDRHHRLGLSPAITVLVRRAVAHCARYAVLPGGVPAQSLWSAGTRHHRGAAGFWVTVSVLVLVVGVIGAAYLF